MSGGRSLLLFLDDGIASPRGWLRLDDGAVVARGTGAEGLAPAGNERADDRVIAVVPGADVVIHWIELPDLAPQQAVAAARLLASEASAEPVERLHVAVGSEDGEGRAMALVAVDRMRAWIDQAQALGFDPESVIPEPLLLPADDMLRRWEHEGRSIVRGPGVALAMEPELASLAVPGPTVAIDAATMEGGLPAALEALPVDLRQGVFARRRRWRIDWPLVRRLAWLGGAILIVTVLVQLALILRYQTAADRLDREIALVAGKALPRAANVDNAAAQLGDRLAELRGAGVGYSATASAIFTAARDTANVELGALQFDADGSVRLTVQAASAADLAAFAQRIEAQGLITESSEARAGGGRQMADITVRAP